MGNGIKPVKLADIKSEGSTISTMKKGIGDNEYIIRLFNPLDKKTKVNIDFPIINNEFSCVLKGNEFKTFILDIVTREVKEADLLERVLE